MTEKKISKFHEEFSKLLGAKLARFQSEEKSLNPATCVEVYMEIFDTMVELFQTSGVELSNEGMNYLAQQYYDGILINGTQELDPNIFDKRAKLEAMETKEIALLAVMLNGTDFAIPLIQEVKRRS